ncbi:MAG: hypothetical protein OXN83_00480 [Oligoflexia bacterium]|nr:hypothetical protein [Oligoflexia bacterium]
MNQILKTGLSLMVLSLAGNLSYALSPAPPKSGSCSFYSKPSINHTVCTKGEDRISYEIKRDSMSMRYSDYNYPSNPFGNSDSQNNGSPHVGPVSPAGQNISDRKRGSSPHVGPVSPGIGGCHTEGFFMNFCQLYKHVKYLSPHIGSNRKSLRRVSVSKLLFSHHKKYPRRVCWANDGSKKANSEEKVTKTDPCEDTLKLEIAQKRKEGWTCKDDSWWGRPPKSEPIKKQQEGQR